MAKNKLAGLVKPSTACDVPPMPYKPSREEQARQRRYQAEDDLRTITRAQEVQKDRTRMAAVKTIAREQMKSLANVAGGKRK